MKFKLITKFFFKMEQAEMYLENLYDDFSYVKLIKAPFNLGKGDYIFRVGNYRG